LIEVHTAETLRPFLTILLSLINKNFVDRRSLVLVYFCTSYGY